MAFISMVFAFLAVILFILGILQVVGTVLLSMACVPVFYIICMLQ